MKAAKKTRPKKAGPKTAPNDLRAILRSVVAGGGVRLVDLTQTLSPDFPPIVLPPEMGQSRPFRTEEISRYDDRGPAWYWNNVSFGEHTGTHFDAPIHWISGRDLPDNSVDALPVEHFIAPACVVDCSTEAQKDADFLLTARHVKAWETLHGGIPSGSWVLMRTDWSKRADPVAYQNLDETGQHKRRVPIPIASAFWCKSATCSASAPRRSAPMPARRHTSRRRIRAITTCTAPANTGCNVCAISIACRQKARSLSPRR
jgi:kynurenine formamidase